MEFTPEQLAAQRKAMRRGANRIGIALLLSLAAAYLSIIGIELLIGIIDPWALYQYNLLMAISDFGIYFIGGIVLYLLLLPLPAAWPERRSLTPRRFGKLALESIGLMYSTAILTTILIVALTSLLGKEYSNLMSDTLDELSLPAMVLFVAVIAPICEELIFRRILLRKLLPMGQRYAVATSALAFGLFHTNLEQLFYTTALGALLACVVIKTGKLRYSILLHMLINLLGSVVITAVEPYPVAENVFVIAIYLLMLIGLVVLVRDRHNLRLTAPSLPHCFRATFTAPGWLLYVLILGVVSVYMVLA